MLCAHSLAARNQGVMRSPRPSVMASWGSLYPAFSAGEPDESIAPSGVIIERAVSTAPTSQDRRGRESTEWSWFCLPRVGPPKARSVDL